MSVQKLHTIDQSADYSSRLHSLLGSSPNNLEPKGKFRVRPIFSEDHAYEIVNSKVTFDDVILEEGLKCDLEQLVDEYENREILKRHGMDYDNILLFEGPSGCGKTLTAMVLAFELKKKLYLVNLSTVVSSNLGRTSNNIFQIVEDAKMDNAIIFFDEFDALASSRISENDHGEIKRVTSALLQMMDFLGGEVVFVAATNHPELIDEAILRRFKRHFKFVLPNKDLISRYLKSLVKVTGLTISPSAIKTLSKKYEGSSYAKIRDGFLSKLKKYILVNRHKVKSNKIGEDILGL